MTMLKLYCVFHLNLMYSSIEIEDRAEVIEKCYWPLLKLVDSFKIPIGIELSGYTLEQIDKTEPEWIRKLCRLLKERKVELIGSGYVQIIGPLVPTKLNDWNQKLGLDVYKKILGIQPKIALVNEMAYSAGIIEHYLNNGYKAIIMEWNNPRRYHPEWGNKWRYFPQYAIGTGNKRIPAIWADSIAFQKFQCYAQGEMDLENYIKYLQSHCNKEEIRYFPMYANDAEIFDFRPNRYSTEAEIDREEEWSRIAELFNNIKRISSFKLIRPSGVLSGLNDEMAGNELRLESPEQPIPVKKQEKYNINRWALTGRNDLNINTICYKIYNAFLKGNPDREDWKELCYLWSSDFRTHITEKRWWEHQERLNNFHKKWVSSKQKRVGSPLKKINLPYTALDFSISEKGRYIYLENRSIRVTFNKLKGLTIDGCWFKDVSSSPLFGTLPHGYYDDISLGADYFSGHAIIERPGEHKITDLARCNPSIFINPEDSSIVMRVTIEDRGVCFDNKIMIEQHSLKFMKEVSFPLRKLSKIYPLNFTFIPNSWDENFLFFATNNGGELIEKFSLANKEVNHSQLLSSLISAKYGLGATEGRVIIGDTKKSVCFEHSLQNSALIPSIYYKQTEGRYFFRLQYSAQEMDETFMESKEEHKLNVCLKIALCREVQ